MATGLVAWERLAGLDPRAPDVVWVPPPEVMARARITHFLQRHQLPDLPTLLARAAAEPEWFYAAVVEDLELRFQPRWQRLLDESEGPAWARWFVGAGYNWVENALDRHADSPRRQQLAVIGEREDGTVRALSYHALRRLVDSLASGLRHLGVQAGDRVGIFLPMGVEAVAAVLACGRLGAIYTPIFSGYAAGAVATRLADCEARWLITADGFTRRGKLVPLKEVADEAVRAAPSVERVVVARVAGASVPWREGRDVWWDDLLAAAEPRFSPRPTAADEPYMIIYTSGTTGRPKGAVHLHAGFPFKATLDLAYCFDLRPGDLLFWFTDLGWMMGPWAISGALTLGATLVCYDGAPDHPGPDRLWSMVARHGVSVLGLAPTVVRALMGHGEAPLRAHDLSSLRVIGSSGEPWNPEPWRWYFEQVGGGRCPLINYSGGTEISGGIVGGYPIAPQRPCSFAGPIPGMVADVVDEAGRPVRGAVGELVLRRPWPGMTRGFWNDPARYEATYWARWPGLWAHGDWAEIDEHSYWYIHGRSDDTIKVAGKRIGPAEVESAAVAHPAVLEAAAVGLPDEIKGEQIAVFAVLRPGQRPSDELRAAIADTVAAELGRALRPALVRFVHELPKTRNAKVLRRVVRARALGLADLGDLSSLENPSALEAIAAAE